jgi:hypothetical protein
MHKQCMRDYSVPTPTNVMNVSMWSNIGREWVQNNSHTYTGYV